MGEDAERSPHGQDVHVEPFTDTWFACHTSGLNHFPSLDHLSVRFSICLPFDCDMVVLLPSTSPGLTSR